MKSKRYQLTIENPCNQNWDSMSPNNIGRHCNQCSKTVVDFTKMSDQEVIDVLIKPKENVCGRLTNSQLKTYTIPDNSSDLNFPFKRFLSGLFLFGVFENAAANQVEERGVRTQTVETNVSNKNETVPMTDTTQSDSVEGVVQGRVIDSYSQEPLMDAYISLMNSGLIFGQILSDSNGYFKLTVPDSLANQNLTLAVSYVGYEPREFTIEVSELMDERIVEMKLDVKEDNFIYTLGYPSLKQLEKPIKKKRKWQFWKK